MGAKNIKPMKMLKSLGHKIVGFDEGFNCLPTSVDGAESK